MQSSTVYTWDFVAVRRGGMFHPNTAIGIQSIYAFGPESKPGRGAVSVTLAEIMADSGTTASIAPRFAPIFRQRAEKGFQRRALGGSRDGFTSKLHCLADARGRPLAFHLTVGRTADCKAYDPLISLPEQALQALIADKGHDADAIRNDPASRNIDPFIPGRANRRVKIEYDRTLYKQRNLIEQINCAIATRYDQLAENFISRVHIATARYWLKFVHAA